jgi:hypothetical protein
MKKVIAICSALLGIIFLAGCGQQSTSQIQPTASAPVAQQPTTTIDQVNYFTNNELGIKFIYQSDYFKGKLTVQDNKVIYKHPDTDNFDYIALFTKKDTQTIEEAILAAVKNEDKNPANCKVVNKGEYWANPKYNEYVLDLANSKITYTKQESEEIRLADLEAKNDGGPFNGEWKKQEIYNKRLVGNCSDYAEPLGLGTSKSTHSRFIYNNKNRIVFLPGSWEPPFYQENSIELFD